MYFLYQRSGHFRYLLPSGKMSIQIFNEHPGFFDTEVNCRGNPRTNVWNILRFSSTYVSDFTATQVADT